MYMQKGSPTGGKKILRLDSSRVQQGLEIISSIYVGILAVLILNRSYVMESYLASSGLGYRSWKSWSSLSSIPSTTKQRQPDNKRFQKTQSNVTFTHASPDSSRGGLLLLALVPKPLVLLTLYAPCMQMLRLIHLRTIVSMTDENHNCSSEKGSAQEMYLWQNDSMVTPK